MSRLEHYEAGALSAWTPAAQAALNAERHDKQQLADADPAFEALREQEATARKEARAAYEKAKRSTVPGELERCKAEMLALDEIWGPDIAAPVGSRADVDNKKWGRAVGGWDDQVTAEGRLKGADRKKKQVRAEKFEVAEAISAGEVIDNLIWSWNPPIHDFLDVWGPPHIVVIPYVAAHLYFWYKAPWYLRFLIYQPTIYYIPLWSALMNLKNKKVRLLWIVYFMNLAIIEYIELLFYRDRARSSVMFPKLKAMFCLISYTIVVPGREPVYGAIKLVKTIFPPPEVVLTKQEKKEKREAKAAASKKHAEAQVKDEEEKAEKERVERRERRAKQAAYIEAHS